MVVVWEPNMSLNCSGSPCLPPYKCYWPSGLSEPEICVPPNLDLNNLPEKLHVDPFLAHFVLFGVFCAGILWAGVFSWLWKLIGNCCRHCREPRVEEHRCQGPSEHTSRSRSRSLLRTVATHLRRPPPRYNAVHSRIPLPGQFIFLEIQIA